MPSESSPHIDPPIIDRFAGHEVVGRLARGGMAEILLAKSPSPQNGESYLVLKRMLPKFERKKEFVEMFLDEARIGMQIEHPNICEVYRYGEDQGSYFIAMEWVDGVSVRQLLRRASKHGGIGIPVALHVGMAVADALESLHSAKDEHGDSLGLVHRDVSLRNIMLSYEGEVKLLDFGIAKANRRLHRTRTGVVKGKFAYLAPERISGGIADHRVDVFSLGVCLFEMLVERSLFGRSNEAQTIQAVLNDSVPSLSEHFLDDVTELDRIVQKALAKDPADRYATARGLADDMSDYALRTNQMVTRSDLAAFVRRLYEEKFAET